MSAEGGGLRRSRRAVGWFALVYGIFHHSGTLFTPLGEMPFNAAWGQTRWADWLDLFTPYLMVLLAAWALAEAAAARRAWAIFAAGAVTYVEGHGVHLSANSISNRHPSDLVHLWDETVGHYLLHAGLALMVVGLMLAIGRQPRFPVALALPLAVLAGMTHVTNALEGGTAVMGILTAGALSAWGWRWRGRAGGVLLWVYLPALIALLTYGLVREGFSPPSAG